MKTPFNMYIVGSTGSGKTYTLLKILETELFQEFTYIFLICPTYRDNKTYQEWKYEDDPKFIVLDVTQDEVEENLSLISGGYRNTNSLIILDDCASCQSVKQIPCGFCFSWTTCWIFDNSYFTTFQSHHTKFS